MYRIGLAGVVVLWGASLAWGAAWTGAPSPHDRGHVVVVRPGDWHDAAGKTVVPLTTAAAIASPPPAPLTQKFSTDVHVRHAGQYHVWLRLSSPPRSTLAARVKIAQEKATPLVVTVPQATAKPTDGGPTGYAQFAKLAAQTGASGGFEEKAKPINTAQKGKNGLGDLLGGKDDLLADIEGERGAKKVSWIHDTRLESDRTERPFYWYRVGSLKLAAGSAQVSLQPTVIGAVPVAPATNVSDPVKALAIDALLLTTVDDFNYPFIGDIDAPPASYVRFRIDEPRATKAATKRPAADGLKVFISGSMRIHYDPFSTAVGYFNPTGRSKLKPEPHTEPGYTRWYRLQDIERAPAFGATEAHLLLHVSNSETAAASVIPPGATQFAVFPHEDYVLREIDWQEPEGLRVSMLTDFDTHLHRLRTFRDHAREDYDKALDANGGRLFPLTRGPLYFGNAWGGADGEATDYMVKTFRLLGFNCVGQAREPIAYRKLYGWTSHGGHYWPPAHLPFDEAASRAKYDEHYAHYFDREREFYQGVSIFQVADEPGEIAREGMTAPLWRFETAEQAAAMSPAASASAKPRYPQGRWRDVSGDSELYTRRTDLNRQVLEGVIEKLGTRIGFYVAVDKAGAPDRYAYWNIGAVSVDRTMNLSGGRHGFGTTAADEGLVVVARPAAAIANTPAAFKIVYDGPQAALFLNGRLVHQHDKLPEQGGFAIVGGVKAISALRLRPMKTDERLANANAALAGTETTSATATLLGGDDLGELLSDPTKAAGSNGTPTRTLEQLVREEFVFGGGQPEAHVGFRNWAKAQGLTPEIFGQAKWDEVHLLTMAEVVSTSAEARLFYWSRRYSGWLTPRMFGMSAEAIQRHAPNPSMLGFVALSGHSLYFPSAMPLDMFQLGADNSAMMPGISDWMSTGSWQWDSHQAVAYSVAPFNAGARRYPTTLGGERPAPVGSPMMHCVWPSEFRAYTMLANQVKYISFYNFGPSYMVTEGHWNDALDCYKAVHRTANRAAQVDDILASGRPRPSRVAMLYSVASEYWNAQASFADKRAAFLALSHEYYQPELVTEEQVLAGALENYDALYVLDPVVAGAAQTRIAGWVRKGGLLWTCADALRFNEFNEPQDGLAEWTGIRRTFARQDARPEPKVTATATTTAPRFSPVAGGINFRPHTVSTVGLPQDVTPGSATVRGVYEENAPAWLECDVEKGRVVYLRHRCGSTYTAKAIRRGGHQAIWSDTGRASLALPLHERKVPRELSLSEPCIVAAPLSTADGTVIVLYNMIPTGSRKVAVELAEVDKPASVERFDGLVKVPVAFEHQAGRVRFTLDELSDGQMIVVRRRPAAVDERNDQLRATTLAQLREVNDPRALATGAWTAGFHPDWNLAKELTPLVTHARWDVRRAAVESLGRLATREQAGAIAKAAEQETDSHVLAEQLLALARLDHPNTLAIASQQANHREAIVRRGVALAAKEWLARHPSEANDSLRMIAARAADDLDLRVRAPGLRLLAQLDPQELVTRAATAYRDDASPADRTARSDFTQAIAEYPAALEVYTQADFSGGDALLFNIALYVEHSPLAERMQQRLATLSAADAGTFSQAVIRQRNKPLTRAVYAARDNVPAVVKAYLPVMLENTFAARIGDVLEDWQAFLAP